MARLTEEEFKALLTSNPDVSIDGAKTVNRAAAAFAESDTPYLQIKRPCNHDISEHADQVILFKWIRAVRPRYPALEYVHAVPNGGHRAKATAAKMKAEGLEPGVPDIMVPRGNGEYYGMAIEMKKGYNKPTEDQDRWLRQLCAANWYCIVAWHRETARTQLSRYFGIPNIPFEEVL